jgi:tetratricopeptide (TPR) repeat protein
LFGLGWLSLLEGRFEEAAEYTARLQSLAQESGYPSARLDAEFLLLYRDLLEGRPDRALTRMDAADVATQADPHIRPIYLAHIAEAHLELGHLELAEELLDAGLAQSGRADTHYGMVEPMLVRAKLLICQQRWKEATDRLEELLEFVGFSPHRHARTLYEYGMMELQRGEPEQARARLAEALAIFRRLGALPYVERTEKSLRESAQSDSGRYRGALRYT